MSKPASLPRWADAANPADIVDPPSGKKDSGWLVNDQPPHTYFNWFWNLVYQWTVYLDGLTGEALTWTAAHIFNAGATFNGVSTTPGLTANAANASGGKGVYATAANAGAYAGDFSHTGAGGVALLGRNNAAGGFGVSGAASASQGVGVVAVARGNGTGAALSATATDSGGTAVQALGNVNVDVGDVVIDVDKDLKYGSTRAEWSAVALSTLQAQLPYDGRWAGAGLSSPNWFGDTASYTLLGGRFVLPANANLARIEFLLTNTDGTNRTFTYALIREAFDASGDSTFSYVDPGGGSSTFVIPNSAGTRLWYGHDIGSTAPAGNDALGKGGAYHLRVVMPVLSAADNFVFAACRVKYTFTNQRNTI